MPSKHTEATRPAQTQPGASPVPGQAGDLGQAQHPLRTSRGGGAEQPDAAAAPQEKPPPKLRPLGAFPPWPLFWEWLENVSRALGAGGGSGKRKNR